MKNYELLEHTADIAVLVKADSLKELFVNAASAMFEIMADPGCDRHAQMISVSVSESGGNSEELLVNWLNQLLYISATKEVILRVFQINEFSERALKAQAFGLPAAQCEMHIEIKAATYHELAINGSGEEWQAKVVFDV